MKDTIRIGPARECLLGHEGWEGLPGGGGSGCSPDVMHGGEQLVMRGDGGTVLGKDTL